MQDKLNKIKNLFKKIKTQLHDNPLIKFSTVLLIFITYMIFSLKQFGAKEGLLVSLLTWTFFVLCTPIADAGFIIDLPIRLLTGIRMVYSELIVWSIAIGTNLIIFFTNKAIYENTKLLSLFYHIISQPIPFWLIIILSALGTFLSLFFGDELVDISKKGKVKQNKHRKYKQLILIITLFLIIFAIYDFLLHKLGIAIPLIG